MARKLGTSQLHVHLFVLVHGKNKSCNCAHRRGAHIHFDIYMASEYPCDDTGESGSHGSRPSASTHDTGSLYNLQKRVAFSEPSTNDTGIKQKRPRLPKDSSSWYKKKFKDQEGERIPAWTLFGIEKVHCSTADLKQGMIFKLKP